MKQRLVTQARLLLTFTTIFFFPLFSSLHAFPISFAEGILLKDAQADEILHAFADPILQKAGISPQDVRILLLATPIVNAASTIGNLIFVNTGLIMRCDNGAELAAVLAHEIGHLQKHHVITRLDAMGNAATLSLGAIGIGALLAALTGNPGPLMAGVLGGQHVAERSFLQFTRTQESEADLASFAFLERLGWPVEGSATFMEKLMEERGPLQDAKIVYSQTHPLHEERIITAKQKMKAGATLPLSLQQQFQILKVKVLAYSLPIRDVLINKQIQNSPYKLYGLAIGAYRQGNLSEAIRLLQQFAQDCPPSCKPYVDELLAQLFFEKSDLISAEQAIQKAIHTTTVKHATLYTLAAQIKMALKDSSALIKAREFLDKAIHLDPDDPQAWRLLGTVYGKQRQEGDMNLCFAEEAIRIGDKERATRYSQQAQKKLSPHTPAYRRATDLIKFLKTEQE